MQRSQQLMRVRVVNCIGKSMDNGMNRRLESHELPYLKHRPGDSRGIVVMPYYDNIEKQFSCYVIDNDNKLLPFRPAGMVSGSYVARELADIDHDIHLPLSETIFQHFSLPNVWSLLIQLERDLQNALSSLHKYFVILRYAQESNDHTAGSLISTEVEYAIGNHRSFYDLIQRVVMAINSKYHQAPNELTDSFAKLAQKDTDHLCNQLKLPTPVAAFYRSRADAFLLLRDIRDKIFHHGHSPDTVFIVDDGFAVAVADLFQSRFKKLELWPDNLLKSHGLGSVLAVFAFIVCDLLDTMSSLDIALKDSFQTLPTAVAEGFHVYLRSPLGRHFHLLPQYRNLHWFRPDEILGQFAIVRKTASTQ
jgi:hypothetical protein